MTKARTFAGYAGSTMLLILGALLTWQVYVLVNNPFGIGSTVIAWGFTTKLWVVELVFALLAAACITGAILIMVRRPHRAARVATQ